VAILGLPVVVVACVLVALNADPTDPTPKGTYAAVFGIIGAFVVVLLVVQELDLREAHRAASRPSIEPGTPVDNPMTTPMVDLWASLAIAPISDEAARANDASWGLVRRSQRTGWIVFALIFVTVPMTYMLETFVPVLIGAALIVIVAVVYLAGLLGGPGGGGGSLDEAYEEIDASMRPLGLAVTERPEIGVGTRAVPPYGLKSEVSGALRMDGRRHGRRVEVMMDDGGCEVRVHGSTAFPAFEAKARDGKVRGKRKGELPPEVEAVLASVPGSTAWKGTAASSDADGIVVRQKPIPGQGWLPGLWLAERLASVVLTRARAGEGARSRTEPDLDPG